MNNFDIEGYIEGTLSDRERRAIELEIDRNTAFAEEVALQQQLTRDLKKAALSDQIKAALNQPPPNQSSKNKMGTWLLSAVFLALAVSLFFLFKTTPKPESQFLVPIESSVVPEETAPTPILKEEEKVIEESKKTPPKEKKQEKTTRDQPVAENKTTLTIAPPLYPSPNLRGESKDDQAWQAFLNKIWYTEYPIAGLTLSSSFEKIDAQLKERNFSKAYARLQRLARKMEQNDTLQLLQGYTLLEMGEGKEALLNFEDLEKNNPQWQLTLDWYRGLSLLIIDAETRTAAKAAFEKIAKQPNHPFHLQAKKALLLLR